jgi:hypothetical protein
MPHERAPVKFTAEEQNAMTLQVGLVGIDGIVIASDRLLQQTDGLGGRSVSYISKFLQGEAVLCCWSGDSVSEHAANIIRDVKWSDVPREKEAVRAELKRLGNQALAEKEEAWKDAGQQPPQFVRKVIVGCHDTLWLLEIQHPSSTANPFQDRVVAGDPANTSRHFMNKYADGSYQLPVTQLVTLAAYVVLQAAEEHPKGIGGLELVVLPKGGVPLFLNSEQENQLTQRCKRISLSIEGHLREPFECA